MNFRDTVVRTYEKAIADLPLTAGALAAFVVVTLVFYVAMVKRERGLSLGDALRYVFPADLYRQPTSRVDMWNYFLTLGLWLPLVGVFGAVLVGFNVRDALVALFGPTPTLLTSAWAIVPVQFLAILLAREFGAYWLHRAQHRIPLLWGIHRVHHSAEALTVFAALRDHPVDFLMQALVVTAFGGLGAGLILFATGTDLASQVISVLVVYNAAKSVLFLFHHSHVWLSFGPLNRIFQAPINHQLHHSAELRHRDRNMGSSLSIFDWIFGTLYIQKAPEQYRLGLNNYEIGETNPHNTLRGFYLEPFVYCWQMIRTGRWAPVPNPEAEPGPTPDAPPATVGEARYDAATPIRRHSRPDGSASAPPPAKPHARQFGLPVQPLVLQRATDMEQ